MSVVNSKTYKILELITLSVIIPFLILFFKLAPYILLFLWSIFAYCIFIFYFCNEKNSTNQNSIVFNSNVGYFIAIRWVICSLILILLTVLIFPEKLFIVQKSNPGLIWKIIVLYPIFSALPQEFIFCKFFFSRYRHFFGEQVLMVTMSSAAFCIAHVLFINWVAPVLGFIAGLIFAGTFRRTKSLLIISVEHSLYGNTLFFIGLGWFFWGGSVG